MIKTSKVVEEKSDSLGDVISGAVEKGKDLIEDLKPDSTMEEIEDSQANVKSASEPEVVKKSTCDCLKDKGLM